MGHTPKDLPILNTLEQGEKGFQRQKKAKHDQVRSFAKIGMLRKIHLSLYDIVVYALRSLNWSLLFHKLF
ncbi:hypothetical protein SDC9_98506 [bioreactor metagenome]|uniref:Uncharacterized protein n=1 Tax=bioreactor metagenome TaxID=1076179 RepID=A0A645AEW9_9ZZZZ